MTESTPPPSKFVGLTTFRFPTLGVPGPRADGWLTPTRLRRQKLRYQRKVMAKLCFCRAGKGAWASRSGQSGKLISFLSVGFAGSIVAG